MKSLDTKHLEKDLKRISAQGGAYSLISQGLMVTIQMSTMIILARLLSPADFGLFAIVASITGFILLFRDLGLSTATIQKPDITQEEVTLLFWINITLAAGIALAMVLMALVYHHYYPDSKLAAILAVMSIGTLVSGFGTQHQAILNRLMRFRTIAISDISSIFLSSMLGIFCGLAGLSFWSLVLMQVSYSIINTTLLWILSGWRPGRPVWTTNARELLAFGGHLTGANVMTYFARNIDNVLIGFVWGPVQVGYYSRATQLLLQPTLQISALLKNVLIPTLSRLNNSPAQIREMCCSILSQMARISFPAITLMLMTSDWIIRVVLGDKWEPSALIFSCLSIATLLQPVNAAAGIILIAQGRPRELFHVISLTSLAMAGAICIGLPWGATGVALAISLCELVVRMPCLFHVVGKSGPLKTADLYYSFVHGIAPSIVVFAVVAIIRRSGIELAPLQGLLVSCPLSGIAALMAIYVVPGGRAALLQIQYILFSVLPARMRA